MKTTPCPDCLRPIWTMYNHHAFGADAVRNHCDAAHEEPDDQVECLRIALEISRKRVAQSRCRLCNQPWDADAIGCVICKPLRVEGVSNGR